MMGTARLLKAEVSRFIYMTGSISRVIVPYAFYVNKINSYEDASFLLSSP